ncbi:MAG: FHA domain-containing protein [Acidobacteria bacterium]|nr:FHA domain-containing protein [Acidobacteriota bacterium]
MPRIRCPKCSQAYDIPPQIAVQLPTSVATCGCGEWLCGNRERILARFAVEGIVPEIDLTTYKIESSAPASRAKTADDEAIDTSGPRSVRVIARGATESINSIFTIDREPLWIGRRACHVEIDDAELSIRHCSIVRRGDQLLVLDNDSHTGTFLDGEPINEGVIGEGTHLLRVGAALVCIEPTSEQGMAVGQLQLREDDLLEASPQLMKKLLERAAKVQAAQSASTAKRLFIVCTAGPLKGEEYEVGPLGLVVGREGDVRVPDEFLSRKHFSVTFDEEGALRVRDLGSRNGTFLNTLPARNTKAHPGDQIKAGVNEFRVEQRE